MTFLIKFLSNLTVYEFLDIFIGGVDLVFVIKNYFNSKEKRRTIAVQKIQKIQDIVSADILHQLTAQKIENDCQVQTKLRNIKDELNSLKKYVKRYKCKKIFKRAEKSFQFYQKFLDTMGKYKLYGDIKFGVLDNVIYLFNSDLSHLYELIYVS